MDERGRDVTQLALASIHVDQTLQPRAGLDDDMVARYAEVFDQLPAVLVFECDDGFLLADGFHRYAAAKQLGLNTIKAKVKRGDRLDAQVAGIEANLRHGIPYDRAARDKAIYLLAQTQKRWNRGGWTQERIAKEFGLSRVRVLQIIDEQELRDRANVSNLHFSAVVVEHDPVLESGVMVKDDIYGRVDTTEAVIREVLKAPKALREPVLEALAAQPGDVDELDAEEVVETVGGAIDEGIPRRNIKTVLESSAKEGKSRAEIIRAIDALAGDEPADTLPLPLPTTQGFALEQPSAPETDISWDDDGTPQMSIEAAQRFLAEQPPSPAVLFSKAMSAISRVARYRPEEIVRDMRDLDPVSVDVYRDGIASKIAFLRSVEKALAFGHLEVLS